MSVRMCILNTPNSNPNPNPTKPTNPNPTKPTNPNPKPQFITNFAQTICLQQLEMNIRQMTSNCTDVSNFLCISAISSLQCFDAVGWVSGRAHKNLTDGVLAWLSAEAKCK